MEKIPELSEEELIAKVERRATLARISRIHTKVKLMLIVESETIEYLKEDVKNVAKITNKIESELGGYNAS